MSTAGMEWFLMEKLQKYFEKIARVSSFSLLLIAILLLVFNVSGRYLFSYGVPWCEEAIRYCVIIASFFGLSLAVAKNASIKIDFLLQILQGEIGSFLMIVSIVVESIVLLGMLIFTIMLVKETAAIGQITPSTDLPMYIPYIFVGIGVFFCLVRSFQATLDEIRSRSR